MKNKLIWFPGFLLFFLILADSAPAEDRSVATRDLCAACHKEEPGVITGLLAEIDLESRSITMNSATDRQRIFWADDTELNNLTSPGQIANYPEAGFRVNFIDLDGKKTATRINRLDPISSLAPSEKIDHDVLVKIIANPGVKTYDVRSLPDFSRGHLPGAIPLPANQFEKFPIILPKEKAAPIIFYGSDSSLIHVALAKAGESGYSNLRVSTGGYRQWCATEYLMVDVDWLKEAIDKRTPHILIDLRPENLVVNGHITGAVSIAIADLENRKSQFPRDPDIPIIFYGSDSKDAAKLVISWGYRAVGIIQASFDGWQAIGNQVRKGFARKDIPFIPAAGPNAISKEWLGKPTGMTN